MRHRGAHMRGRRRSAGGWSSEKGARRTQHGVQHLLGSPADQPARPGGARGGTSPTQPQPTPRLPRPPLFRLRLSASASGSTAAAPPRGLPGPPPRARPACSSSPPGSSVVLVPLLLRPAVLSLSPSFPQRMSSFQLNLNPLKEPLGFIKVLEWVSAARSGEAWNRAAVTVPVPALARPAPSAGRRGAQGAGARAGAAGSARAPRPPTAAGRDGTGRRGGERGPRAGPARGGDAAVRVESRVPRPPGSRAKPPSHPEAHPWVLPRESEFKFFWLRCFPQGKRKLPVAV